LGIGLFSAVSNVLMLTGPLFMLEIYDRLLPSRSVPTLVLLLLLVAMLFAAQGVIDWIRARMMVRIGSALDETLSARVHQTLVRLALRGGKAEGLEPVRDLDSIRSFLSGIGPTALFDLPWIPLYLCVIFALHPMLGLTALAGAIVLIGLALLAEHLTQAPIKSATAYGKVRYDLAEASRRNAEVLAAMGFGHR
jgi:ABC-type protease/lipase transport system fused ATPase/permease subunit